MDHAKAIEKDIPLQQSETNHGLLNVEHKHALCLMGYVFIKHQQTDKALVVFEALDDLFPKDAHVIKSLSYVYLQAKRYAEALESAERFLREFGTQANSTVLYWVQSQALLGLNRNEEASRKLRDFIEARNVL